MKFGSIIKRGGRRKLPSTPAANKAAQQATKKLKKHISMLLQVLLPILTLSVPFQPFQHHSFVSVRGGGLFDKKVDNEIKNPIVVGSSKYPAMSQLEVEEALAHVPVFAVTDSQGQGIILRSSSGDDDDKTGIFYFFVSPEMANATLSTLQSQSQSTQNTSSPTDLKLSAFSLGKVYFQMLKAEQSSTNVRLPDSDGSSVNSTQLNSTKAKIEYRLVPDTRDLMGARMLLTMDEKDGEEVSE